MNSSLGISLAAAMAASERIAVRRNIVTGCGARLNECAVGSVESEVDYRFIPQNLDIEVLKTTSAIKQRLWLTRQVADVPALS